VQSESVQVGSTIYDGFSAIRVTERVVQHTVRNGRLEVIKGWRGLAIPISGQPEMPAVGTPSYVEDTRLHWWRDVPFEWRPTRFGLGIIEERYVWNDATTKLVRETRADT
jgi:hypothetical protein